MANVEYLKSEINNGPAYVVRSDNGSNSLSTHKTGVNVHISNPDDPDGASINPISTGSLSSGTPSLGVA